MAEKNQPAQDSDDLYRDDGYIEDGVADPGTMQEVDPADEDFLAEEERREEVDDRPRPQVVRNQPNPPLVQRQADPADAIDRGYMEDREGERDEEEGRSPANAETIDPLEKS